MAESKEVEALLGVDTAWVARAQRALGWYRSLQRNATVDEVAEKLGALMNALVVTMERAHGIDPATQEANPAALVAALESERAAKETAEANLIVERELREVAEAELEAYKAANKEEHHDCRRDPCRD